MFAKIDYKKGEKSNMIKMNVLFLKENKGIGKNSGRPYHMVDFHNPETLTNGTMSIAEPTIDLSLLKARQLIEVECELHSEGFKHDLKLFKVKPIGNV
jgi:hypothetical protein